MTPPKRLPIPTLPADRTAAKCAALEQRLGALPSPVPPPVPLTRVFVHATVISAGFLLSLAILVCLLAAVW
jgi:hypothetical protein